ncbi:MAG: hypothetical protein ABSF90_00100 [Syntrophobacteraceae bacterium]
MDFPIIITEGERKTVIIHPERTPEEYHDRYGKDFEVKKLSTSVEWESVILPQDLPLAREMMKEITFDMKKDLDLDGYEGSFSYLVPKDQSALAYGSRSELNFLGGEKGRIRTTRDYRESLIPYSYSRALRGVSSSSSHVRWFSVYRKGILVADVDPPKSFAASGIILFEPKFAINIVGSGPEINLARNTLVGDNQDWFEPIHTAYCKKVVPIDDILSACLDERFRLISRAFTLSFIEHSHLLELLPHTCIPIPYIENNGVCGFMELGRLGNTAFVFPNICTPIVNDSFVSRAFNLNISQEDDVLSLWEGGMCLLVESFSSSHYTFAYFDYIKILYINIIIQQVLDSWNHHGARNVQLFRELLKKEQVQAGMTH